MKIQASTPNNKLDPKMNRLFLHNYLEMSKWPNSFLESVCPTRIPVASRDEKGFELMLGMNVQTKAKKIPGSLVSETAYALTAPTDITENTR